jgi:hypothetical protein
MSRPTRRKAAVKPRQVGRSTSRPSARPGGRSVSRQSHRLDSIRKQQPQNRARKALGPAHIEAADIQWDTIVLPTVMTLWHEDPQYRDASHQPLRLKLRARGPCLAQLIRRASEHGDVRLIACALVRSGAVEQRGPWYTPAGRFVSFKDQPPAALAHTLMSTRALLGTIEHNLHTRDPREARLERLAFNSHIPVSALPTVHRYMKREGDNLLARIDAYLKRWEVPKGSEPAVLVGFAAFAFED